MLELDHVFVCVPNELEVTDILVEFGLNLSARRIHKGQGTANRCVYFNNAYLELLLHNDEKDLQSQSVQPVSLWERMHWRKTGASPFGVAFRFVKDTKQDIPLETWSYHAPFLPDGAIIPIVTPFNSIQEPLVFLSLVTKAPIEKDLVHLPALENRGSRHTLTQVRITTSYCHQFSRQLQWFNDQNLISIVKGAEHHAELEWDNRKQGQILDFRPILPLSISW